MSVSQVLDLALPILVMLGIFVLAYTRMTGKSMKEFIMELREAFQPQLEEVRL